mmetsp:Transcript_41062/g.123997  ORF Transcript_41062/g.123997 Transcript_41062/m.123997 type:complete len:228 (-) Transcript_41062:802-1485(-)
MKPSHVVHFFFAKIDFRQRRVSFRSASPLLLCLRTETNHETPRERPGLTRHELHRRGIHVHPALLEGLPDAALLQGLPHLGESRQRRVPSPRPIPLPPQQRVPPARTRHEHDRRGVDAGIDARPALFVRAPPAPSRLGRDGRRAATGAVGVGGVEFQQSVRRGEYGRIRVGIESVPHLAEGGAAGGRRRGRVRGRAVRSSAEDFRQSAGQAFVVVVVVCFVLRRRGG